MRSLAFLMTTRSRFRLLRYLPPVCLVFLIIGTMNSAAISADGKAPPERSLNGASLGVGDDAWLRYARLSDASALQSFDRVVVFGESDVLGTAETELLRGLRGMLGRDFQIESPTTFQHHNLTS